mmetsp:Transcript_543/g.1107  ORF Transcript_543/g.1107 Transcript_543/m.1107 type:complete len:225 (+) Transcript_543:113-787(+)
MVHGGMAKERYGTLYTGISTACNAQTGVGAVGTLRALAPLCRATTAVHNSHGRPTVLLELTAGWPTHVSLVGSDQCKELVEVQNTVTIGVGCVEPRADVLFGVLPTDLLRLHAQELLEFNGLALVGVPLCELSVVIRGRSPLRWRSRCWRWFVYDAQIPLPHRAELVEVDFAIPIQVDGIKPLLHFLPPVLVHVLLWLNRQKLLEIDGLALVDVPFCERTVVIH